MMVAFAMALFLPAGTLAWPAGWTFFLLVFGFTSGMSLWLLRFNPDLTWDKVFLALMGVAFFAGRDGAGCGAVPLVAGTAVASRNWSAAAVGIVLHLLSHVP